MTDKRLLSRDFDRVVLQIDAGDLRAAARALLGIQVPEGHATAAQLKGLLGRQIVSRAAGAGVRHPAIAALQRRLPPSCLPSGKPWPRISVVTPSYNQGRYIEETLRSVLGQGYPDLEYIVIDGGSSDETVAVVQKYRDQIAHFVSEKDRGQSHALNKGFAVATGQILCWVNSDDQLAPGALHAVALAFDTHEVDVVSGVCEIYEDGVLKHRHQSACADGPLPLHDMLDLDKGWNAGQFFYQPEVFFTRDIWNRAGGGVDESLYYSMDYELWCRFAHAGARLHVIGATLAHFRAHPEQKTAVPENFKRELTRVRDDFARSRGIAVGASQRPDFQWSHRLRVAMVNDNEFKYGAGIAHQRIAAALDLAGNEVGIFTLAGVRRTARGRPDWSGLLERIRDFAPDLILCGNFHAAEQDSAPLLRQLRELATTFWLTHDFWLFTGRCAYPGPCDKFLAGCDETCPTADEYPVLPPAQIRPAWKERQALLRGAGAPVILANSDWSRGFVEGLRRPRGLDRLDVRRISLGVPSQTFRPIDRAEARRALAIPDDDFCVVFTVSSLSDARKGGALLLEALRRLPDEGMTLLLVGNLDAEVDVGGKSTVRLGYLSDPAAIAAALSAGDLFVGPSRQETLGQVFLEAAMVGLPSLGLAGSGVESAIIDGVTGLLVPPDVDALAAAIARLMDEPDTLGRLAFFSRVHAVNEFGLESCYRSIFGVLRAMGIVDARAVPHKIGYRQETRFLAGEAGGPNWIPRKGLSHPEGPYPDGYDYEFRWCHSERSEVAVRLRAGQRQITVVAANPIHEDLRVDVRAGGRSIGTLAFPPQPARTPRSFTIDVSQLEGWAPIEFLPERRAARTASEERELSFVLIAIEHPAP